MPLKTTQWDPSEHLDSPKSIAAYLEAAFEDGDPPLIAAAIGDITSNREAKRYGKPLTTSEGEVRELRTDDAVEAVPFSSLPDTERSMLLKIRKRGSRIRRQKPAR